jgi:hypothetical protein
VFGEEYALAADDNSLTTVLKKHLHILGRDALAEDISGEVLDAEGSRAIVDLMLARSLSQQRNRREHLVVELKAPKVAIGDEQATQIRKYANAVADDPRFDIKEVEWDFVIVSGEVRGWTERERKNPRTPYGEISDADNIRISVLTWADVLESAGHRLKFVQKLLDYQPDAEKALAYLRKLTTSTSRRLSSATMAPTSRRDPRRGRRSNPSKATLRRTNGLTRSSFGFLPRFDRDGGCVVSTTQRARSRSGVG